MEDGAITSGRDNYTDRLHRQQNMSSTMSAQFGSMPQLPQLVAGDDPRDQQISIKNDLNCEDLLDGKIEYKKNGRKIRRVGESDNRAKLSQIKEKLKRNGRYVMSKNTPGKKMAYVAKRIDFSEIFGTNS